MKNKDNVINQRFFFSCKQICEIKNRSVFYRTKTVMPEGLFQIYTDLNALQDIKYLNFSFHYLNQIDCAIQNVFIECATKIKQ